MEQVTTKAPHTYGGKRREVGEKYDADEKFIPALRHIGWLEPGPEKSAVKTPAEKKPKKTKSQKSKK